MTREELTKSEIKEFIANNDYTKLYSIIFFATDNEKEKFCDLIFDIIGNYNHIKNILK